MTAHEIIAALNQKIFCDPRSERKILQSAGLGANTIQHIRKNKNMKLDTLLLLCDELGLVVEVREGKNG